MRKGLYFILFVFSACAPRSVILVTSTNLKSDTSVKPNKAMVSFIQPYKSGMQKYTALVVGKTDTSFNAERPCGSLGNLCSDFLLNWGDSLLNAVKSCKVDMAVLNNGGLRNSLPKGEINLGHMLELMPFENEAIVLKLRGTAVDSLFRHIIGRGGEPVSGLKLEIQENGNYLAFIQGKPFDINREYYIATSDYLCQGGDGFSMLKNASDVWPGKLKMRDVFVRRIFAETAAFGVVPRRNERRIVYANETTIFKK
jgi:2',3'-cyclic-nucleotide 2'-phosphodiesterase (5'-nucleotidase family)